MQDFKHARKLDIMYLELSTIDLIHFQLYIISVYGRLHVMYVWILYELCHVCDLY